MVMPPWFVGYASIYGGIFILQTNKTKRYTFALTATAAMTALSVVLCRYLGFSPEGTPFRFEIGFLPISVIAYMFGPVYSALGYFTADIIGSLLGGYAPNIWISLCQILFGMLLGIFLYRKEQTPLRITICFSVVSILVDFVSKSPVFVYLYGWNWGFTLWTRALNALINLPIRIGLYYITIRQTKKHLDKLIFMKNKNFEKFANSFQAVTIPGLSRISALCEKLGNPQDKLKFIHIAGTNGKGSVSAYISCILEDAGYKVGKYISPNLMRVNERISICGRDISDADLSDIISRIEPLAKEAEKETGESATQFEIWTAASFLYFFENNCDYVVLEVGLGGEFDATNIIKSNVAAVITRLGLDHTQYLGNTIQDVAKAKSGIIKAKSSSGKVFTVMQDKNALEIIKNTALEKGLELIVANPECLGADGIYERFSEGNISDVLCGISGFHQIENASLALLFAKEIGIDEKFIRSGIKRAKNPARFELIRENPTVIYDGGHNENGLEALNKSIKRYFGNVPKTVVFACMKDKEIKESLKLLSKGTTEFIFTTVKDNPRASGANELKIRAEKLGFAADAYENIGDAYEKALSKENLTIICGSLYLYKDFREYIKNAGKQKDKER